MAAAPSHQRPLLHVFSMKSPSSFTLQASMKLKSLIHTLIVSHVCRIARAVSRAKSILIGLLKEHHQLLHHLLHPARSSKEKSRKIFFGSFRLHYNWCSSSHVLPVPAPVLEGRLFCDSAWNSYLSKRSEAEISAGESSRGLSGYLQWLEDKAPEEEDSAPAAEQEMNEIDLLADLFIASCHEKFRLEKQESYRRYQEMLARSM